jgi:hypothetical protein
MARFLDIRWRVAGARLLSIIFLALTLGGCATTSVSPASRPAEAGQRPTAGPAPSKGSPPLSIPDLGACARDRSSPISIDPARPLTILVPGCHASPEQLAPLARELEAQGQQTLCFTYDDREKLERSARRLVTALETLKPHLVSRYVTVLGHSQGGLIARRALVRDRPRALRDDGAFRYELVTVSSPFHGIESSAHCGSILLHVMTLGATVGVCHLVAGAKWAQIHPRSSFMRRPGSLLPSVERHVKIVTDERGTCRARDADGGCRHSDFVFSLAEQYSGAVDDDARIHNTEIKAGHAEIVGEAGGPPLKLMQLLEDEQVFVPASRDRGAARPSFAGTNASTSINFN